MGSLSIALINSAQAQRSFTRALNVLQTNVSNVNTPGYATQNPSLVTQPFNPNEGIPGGVAFGNLQDTRSTFAEQAVRQQQGFLNQNQQLSSDLSRLNPAFDLNAPSSVPPTLSALFGSFSQLAVNPNDPFARQQVIDTAKTAAQAFQTTASRIGQANQQADTQITQTVSAINAAVSAVQAINTERRNSPNSQHDAGLDAQVYAKLEDLSQYVNIQSVAQTDGTVNIYLAGQTPLLVGTHQYSITAQPGPSSTTLLDAQQRDITALPTGGRLAGLLQEKNTILPSYTGQLDTLAQSVADTVNTQLRAGVDGAGNSPSTDLFTYDAERGAASTIGVDSTILPSQIAAADPASPGGNSNALALARLGQTKAVNGQSFIEYYGSIAAHFGRDLAGAIQNAASGQSLLAQAQKSREDISGVSLDQQAAQLVQFQQAYQAAGDFFRVLNQLAEDTINLIR